MVKKIYVNIMVFLCVRFFMHPLQCFFCCGRAFKDKKYQQALDHYSGALASSQAGSGSIVFAAVLYCNRAAAHQCLENWADAIADCARAKALNPDYVKVSSKNFILQNCPAGISPAF